MLPAHLKPHNILSYYLPLLLLALLNFSPSALALTDSQVQSVMIFRFIEYIKWPADEKIQTYNIGLMGQNPDLLKDLQLASEKIQINGRKVKVKTLELSQLDPLNIHVLVTTKNLNAQVHSIAEKIRRSETLLVTLQSDAKRDFMLNIIPNNTGALTFEVNRTNIIFEHLNIDKDILLLGGSELDVAELFRESEYALSQIKEDLQNKEQAYENATQKLSQAQNMLVNVQQKLTVSERSLINDDLHSQQQQLQIQQQQHQLQSQTQQLSQTKTRYHNLLNELNGINDSLLLKQDALLKSQGELSEKQELLQNHQQKVVQLKDSIQYNQKILHDQERTLKQQQQQLNVKNQTITRQRDWLFISLFAVISFVSLLLLILFINQSRKKTIQTLHNTQQQLINASQAKGDFLAKMSHEIRTPLTGILGMSELLIDTSLNQQQQKYNNVIQSSGKVLVTVINDILDYSKIEAGKMDIENITFNLHEMIADIMHMFRHQCEETGLIAFAEIDDDVNRWVSGDSTRIRQVIINLLSNAFKFTTEGSIYLHISHFEEQTNMLQFSVQDSGIGIEKEHIKNLFQPFSQADESTSRKYGGTGLGLAICHQLALLMGGDISVESQLGEGSRFWFIARLQANDTKKISAHTAEPSPLQNKKLLIIASNKELLNIFSLQAKRWGMHVHILESQHLQQAIPLLLEAHKDADDFDLIISDTDKLDDNGFDLFNQINQQSSLQQLRTILFCSSRIVAQNHGETRPGINLIVETPMMSEELKLSVTDALKLSQKTISGFQEDNTLSFIPPLNILVAEDNPVNRMVIKGLLSKLQQQVTFAESGRQAMILFSQADPAFDVIFMDCEMPEMNGFEATESIRAWEKITKRQSTPIFALSAHVLPSYIHQSKASGMNDFIQKPIQIKCIHQHLLTINENKK